MIRAVIKKDILWPQKQEDREEGGWKALPNEKRACDTRTCEDTPVDRHTSMNGIELTESERGRVEGEATDGNLPVIAERLIDASVRGRPPRQSDGMV